MNRFNIYIIAGLFFVFGITIGVNMNYIFNYLGFNSDNLKKYNSLVNYVKNRYYADINIDSLVDESTKELIQKLDPHSAHISKKELSIINEAMEGVFVGIGISFKMKGPKGKIKTTINPIRTLTPRFIQKIVDRNKKIK